MEYPTWFGPAASPLFGIVHVPAAMRVRGAAVICPAIGKEQINTYRGVKQLAEKLCREGMLVLRFDYCGLGDSFGEQAAPDALSRWCDSIVEAVNYVRSMGAADVALIGLRLGALLATASAGRCGPLQTLALWDPVLSGRQYLREERALYRLSVSEEEPPDADEPVPLLGVRLHPTTIAQLTTLSMDAIDPSTFSANHVLLATRRDQRDSASIQSIVARFNPPTLDLNHQEAFVTPPSFVFSVPTASIAELAQRIAAEFGEPTHRVRLRTRRAATYCNADGLSITETLSYQGPHSLFTICSVASPAINPNPVVNLAANDDADLAPTVLFHGTASEYRVGPVRMWVELGRTLALQGFTCVRFDRRGTGDSGAVADDESTPAHSSNARIDALAIMHTLGVPPEQILLAGVCSGAWHSAYAALEFGARAVVMLSLADWGMKQRLKIKRAHIDALNSHTTLQLFELLHRVRRLIKPLQRLIPYPLWYLLGIWQIVQVPEVMLAALWQRNIRSTVIMTPDDYRWFSTQRGAKGLQRLRKRGYRDSLIVCERGDHSLYGREIQAFVRTQLLQTIIAEFAMSAATIAGPQAKLAAPMPIESAAGPQIAF